MQRPRIIKRVMRFGIFSAVLAGAFTASFQSAFAQLPQTMISSVLPAGGKVGSTFEVKVAGTNLEEITRLVFNHPAIKSVQKMQTSAGKKTPVANTFLVTIDSKVPAGFYEVRAVGRYGMSNPRTFVAGRLRESNEKEPNNTTETANLIQLNETINGTMAANLVATFVAQ